MINATQAKFITDNAIEERKTSEEVALEEIQDLIKEFAKRGLYSVRYNRFINDAIIQKLRSLGFEIDTSNSEHIGVKIKWEVC